MRQAKNVEAERPTLRGQKTANDLTRISVERQVAGDDPWLYMHGFDIHDAET